MVGVRISGRDAWSELWRQSALLGRVSWPRSVLGMLLAWLAGGFLLDVATLGAVEATGWAVLGAVLYGLPVVVASIALRVVVPALRPPPHLRPPPYRHLAFAPRRPGAATGPR